MSRALTRRLEALEAAGIGAARCYSIAQYEGETSAQAVSAYEAHRGPVPDGSNILRVFILKPGNRKALA
jgi:peptidoglycan hydrolase-like protein with peptidoglycan-binding domain